MPSLSDPFITTEFFLRRVPTAQWPDGAPTPSVAAFLPRKPNPDNTDDSGDSDGVSISRQLITTPIDASYGPPPSSRRGHVFGITYNDMVTNALTVTRCPTPHDPGHCVIPEMNRVDYDDTDDRTKKKRIKEAALALSFAATLKYQLS